MLPLIFTAGPLLLKWLVSRGGKERSLAFTVLAALLLVVVNFALQFNVRSYFDAPADTTTRTVAELLRQRHSVKPDQRITLAADPSFHEALAYYMWRDEMDWITVTGDLSGTGAGFFFVHDSQFDRLKSIGLREVYRDNSAGAVLAEGVEP
jgi:3',5'-cyclic AMP phosphodiesterase CpdA